jgi:hypothetical protein
MILTVEEYREMGFDEDDEELLERCLKRAEFVIIGLTEGRALSALNGGGKPAEFVKQACLLQAQAILREEQEYENSIKNSESAESSEKVTVGDFSYSTSTGSSSGKGSSSSIVSAFSTSNVVIHLLRAAGCMFGATEVRE